MKREFIRTNEFEKCWLDLGLSEEDILSLETDLCVNPQIGDVIPQTGGLRKLRWQVPNQGKRGGARVIYVDFVAYEKIYLISAYPKSKKVDLSDKEKKEISRLIKALKDQLSKR